MPPSTPPDDIIALVAANMAVWRAALITSAAVDVVLYVAIVAQTVRYFCTRSNDESSAAVARIVDVSGLEAQSKDRSSRFHQRPWDWLVFLVVTIATFKAGCSLATTVILRQPLSGREFCDALVSFPVYIAPFLTALIGLVSGTFYLHRLVKLLRVQESVLGNCRFRAFIMIIIEALFLTTLGLSIYYTRLAADGWDKFVPFATAQLSCAAVGDMLVTGLTLACILNTEKHITETKRSPLRHIARITALSAAVPTITAIANVLCVAIPAVSNTLWHNLPNYALGQLFVLSLLWTLQVRQQIAHQSTESARLTSTATWSTKREGRPNFMNRTSMFARTIPLNDISSEFKN
ncbi:SubName: Full=Uncharacterized protein {ECO:0000313/EMBL:CCA71109.1} [Serendipita indica DSM 11827]|uniref:DUF6534 domain-containing protein n=1 Tax=Serendipita indica (strain DSM 11827) TaxID=1109443 RepID=G4TIG5_SERID|nr:SubName: Full=Uncharacterized protein {ECO:0000313/EMBL:CCA71109.1} [Serendipita indica DSM 11827]CCA71109.1 hypothetical protein PIIN_05044 [Serendipita indica DSM 11827]